MDNNTAKKCQEQMVFYISQMGAEKVRAIEEDTQILLRKAKDEYIKAEKERIINDYKQKLVQDEIKLKIEKSASENRVRIERMQDINQKILALERICAQAIVADQAKDQQKYKHFLRDLIIQVNLF
jgi:hypothetical protein